MLIQEREKELSTIDTQKEIKVYTFLRENNKWYIDLHLNQQGFQRKDLEMVNAADAILNIMARGRNMVRLMIDTEPFRSAHILELVELCPSPKGGGYYTMKSHSGKDISEKIWLRDVALLVFGDMPERIYIKQVKDALALN